MRGTTEWVNALESAFKQIKLRHSQDINSCDLNATKNVLVYRMGDVLLWNENTLSLFCVNVKAASEISAANCYQELVWNNPPRFEISKILLSPTESQLALYGSDGVQILTIPSIKGAHGLFKDGADSVTCCCLTVDEKHFVMSGRNILCCKWHPGFSSPNVLVLLTSENFFRIYRADTPQEPFQVIDLNIPLVSSKNVLGESFVSFDFSDESVVPSSDDEKSDQPMLYWTAYLLIGNGQVCSCAMFYDAKSSFKHVLHGPLSVYPPAEDNYGCDACSILYLNSSPPTLVIATSEGKLHHCILLNSESSSVSDKNVNGEEILDIKEQSLYVFETVQLELSLKTPDLDTSFGCSGEEMDSFSCSLQLYKDPVMRHRYHCCHISGLHSVHISWLFNLEKYFGDENIKLDYLDQDEHCIVEHLLCTKPLPLSSISPIIGFLQIVDVLLGSKIVCMTSNLQISIFPLLQSYKISKHPLSSEHPTDLKPLQQRGDFSDKIKKILQKKSMNPLIKGSQLTSSQDSFKLLCRATQVFREEYIQKYEQVQVELEKNTFRLKTMKARQEAEVKQLQKDYSDAREKQSNMTSKLETILSNQERLSDRLKNIGHKIEVSIPMLSESEDKMKKTLKVFHTTIESYEKSINQLSRKCEHYHKEKSKSALSSKSSCSIITEEKANSIHTLLKKEGDEISQLKNDLKVIQSILEV